jgi:trehalose 6-phosphate phosphatase
MTETGCLLPAPSADWALFLDIDGTLLELAPTPSEVVVPPGLPGLLSALKRALGGAVALVSGRSLADIDALFSPLEPIAAGQHGAEIRLPNGATERLGRAGGVLTGLMEKIGAFAAARPGILVEDKGMTIAVHCRQAPGYQAELGRFLADLTAAHGDRLETIGGHRVFEIKPRNLSKRTAVERLMRIAPFAGRLPLFIGDDRTDEDGFAAVRALGGHAIRVGPDGPDPGWTTIATWRMADPACARAFLSDVVTSLNTNTR